MSKSGETVLKVLSQTQLDFIKEELGYDKEAIRSMDDDAIDQMYDQVCDIEVDETIAADDRGGEYSDRELMAEGIVTAIGNELYRPEDEPEEEDGGHG